MASITLRDNDGRAQADIETIRRLAASRYPSVNMTDSFIVREALRRWATVEARREALAAAPAGDGKRRGREVA